MSFPSLGCSSMDSLIVGAVVSSCCLSTAGLEVVLESALRNEKDGYRGGFGREPLMAFSLFARDCSLCVPGVACDIMTKIGALR